MICKSLIVHIMLKIILKKMIKIILLKNDVNLFIYYNSIVDTTHYTKI